MRKSPPKDLKPTLKSPVVNPVVSVVIPTFNASDRLRLLVESLANQSSIRFEIIIVDDGSMDDTKDVISRLRKSVPIPLRYYYLDNTEIFGAGMARNYGVTKAKGKIILFLDQDCVAEKDLIRNHINHHKTKDIILGYYAGYNYKANRYALPELYDYVREDRPLPEYIDFRDQLFAMKSPADGWKCFVSAHFSIKRSIFTKFYFDESFVSWGCEDVDFGYRLFSAGYIIYFEKTCRVFNSSSAPILTKKKLKTLIGSLIQMYKKHKTHAMKLYCFERFYTTELKYRGYWQLVFKNNDFMLRKSKTSIYINRSREAIVMAGTDFLDSVDLLEQLIPLIHSMSFNLSGLRILTVTDHSRLIDRFQKIIKVLRDKKITINTDDIRRQGFLMGLRLLGPKLLGLDFYNKCNFKCVYCSTYMPGKTLKVKPREVVIDLSVARKILDQAYEMGVETIRISADGEPLLSPDAIPILSYIAQKGFKLQLLTNGTQLRAEHIAVLLQIPAVDIYINYSAATKRTYQQIHGGGPDSYDHAIRVLEWLVAKKRKMLQHADRFRVATTFVITRQNCQEIADYVLHAKRLGVDSVWFRFALPNEDGRDVLIGSDAVRRVKIELLKAKSLSQQCLLPTNIDDLLNDFDQGRARGGRSGALYEPDVPAKYCFNGWFFGRFNPYGEYYICCRETVPVGDLAGSSFKDIYFSKRMTDVLAEGAAGVDHTHPMWRKCGFCYHIQENRIAQSWLEQP